MDSIRLDRELAIEWTGGVGIVELKLFSLQVRSEVVCRSRAEVGRLTVPRDLFKDMVEGSALYYSDSISEASTTAGNVTVRATAIDYLPRSPRKTFLRVP